MEQDPLIVAVDPADVDLQHPGRLDHFQPRQKPLHATDRRVRRAGLDAVQRRMRIVVADGDQRIEAVAHRGRQTLGHALRQQGAGLLSGTPHRASQRRVGRGEDVFVAKPAPRPRQQRAREIEPQRFVLEEPRQPFSGSGVERAQTQVLADAPLMRRDRLLPAGVVGVDRPRRRRPTAGPRTSGSLRRSPGAPVGGICRAHARRRPGTRSPAGCGNPAAG